MEDKGTTINSTGHLLHPDVTEPNDVSHHNMGVCHSQHHLREPMVDSSFYGFDGPYNQMARNDKDVSSAAPVIFIDVNEVVHAGGYFWNSLCCDPGDMATTRGWEPQSGGLEPLDFEGVGMDLTLRIGTSTQPGVPESLHESLTRVTRNCIACAWSSMCAGRSLFITCLSC